GRGQGTRHQPQDAVQQVESASGRTPLGGVDTNSGIKAARRRAVTGSAAKRLTGLARWTVSPVFLDANILVFAMGLQPTLGARLRVIPGLHQAPPGHLSNAKSTHPIIISSHVWSPQKTVLFGSGLLGFLSELSKCATQ